MLKSLPGQFLAQYGLADPTCRRRIGCHAVLIALAIIVRVTTVLPDIEQYHDRSPLRWQAR